MNEKEEKETRWQTEQPIALQFLHDLHTDIGKDNWKFHQVLSSGWQTMHEFVCGKRALKDNWTLLPRSQQLVPDEFLQSEIHRKLFTYSYTLAVDYAVCYFTFRDVTFAK